MHTLIRNFLNDNEENKILYRMATLGNDESSYNKLNDKYKNYLFKIHAISYLNKSIQLNAKEFKDKHLKVYKREDLSLNIIDPDFNEERLFNIADTPVDYIEEITLPKSIDFSEIFTDKSLINAVKCLTSKQKEILFLIYVQDLEEKCVAGKLGISVQAVNKIKKTALNKIRSKIREM